jgi:hypothetical protein
VLSENDQAFLRSLAGKLSRAECAHEEENLAGISICVDPVTKEVHYRLFGTLTGSAALGIIVTCMDQILRSGLAT